MSRFGILYSLANIIIIVLCLAALIAILSKYRTVTLELSGVPVKLPPKFARLVNAVKNETLSVVRALDFYEKSQSRHSSNADIWLAKIWLQMKEVESGVHIDSLREDFDHAYEDMVTWKQKYGDRDIEPLELAFAELDKRLGRSGL